MSVEGSAGCYLVVLGQYGVVLVASRWYWIRMERNWLVHDGVRSEGGTGYYLAALVLGKGLLCLNILKKVEI